MTQVVKLGGGFLVFLAVKYWESNFLVVKVMRKIKQLYVVTLILLVCVFFVSCPASPSNIEDSGSSLYQKPLTPQNVKATNGYDGLIRITWDPVEDVDGYIIKQNVSFRIIVNMLRGLLLHQN